MGELVKTCVVAQVNARIAKSVILEAKASPQEIITRNKVSNEKGNLGKNLVVVVKVSIDFGLEIVGNI